MEALAGGKLRLDEPAPHVTRITIDNPQKRNALDHDILDAFADVLPRLEARCLLITATGKVFSAELIGVKPVRAFDTTLVVVALMGRIEGVTRRLVGAAIADDDQATSVAVATLQAVNRLVSPLIVRGDAN